VLTRCCSEVFTKLEDLQALGVSATCMLHPNTFLNKILIGAADGRLQLWNIRTKCVWVGECYEDVGWVPVDVWHAQTAPPNAHAAAR
jgi:hypothetical protein